jgi:hypothetical protein
VVVRACEWGRTGKERCGVGVTGWLANNVSLVVGVLAWVQWYFGLGTRSP